MKRLAFLAAFILLSASTAQAQIKPNVLAPPAAASGKTKTPSATDAAKEQTRGFTPHRLGDCGDQAAIRSGIAEAGERYDRTMDSANTSLALGAVGGATQAGAGQVTTQRPQPAPTTTKSAAAPSAPPATSCGNQ